MAYDFQLNADKILRLLIDLSKFTKEERIKFLIRVSDKEIGVLLKIIRLCSTAKLLTRDKKLFETLIEYKELFGKLKETNKAKFSRKLRIECARKLLLQRCDILNLLGPYLKQIMKEYDTLSNISPNPVTLLPKL